MNKETREIVDIFGTMHYFGCSYGQADGPDDYVNECDCGYSDDTNQQEIKQEG